MQLSIKTRVCLVSAVAAAVLAACGGGSSPEAQSPQSAELDSVELASTPAAPQTAAVVKPAQAAKDSDVKQKPQGGAAPTNKIYIVRLADLPAATYDGRIAGYAATKPAHGAKLNARSPAVGSYRAYLRGKHDAVARTVGITHKHSYQVAFNGFAAEMTQAQADKLKTVKGVLSVTKDKALQMKTASTPAFLGLTGPNGFYARTGAKGENVVIGMIDSGVWPENNAFTDRTNENGTPDRNGGNVVYGPEPGWNGTCQTTADFPDGSCNNKLIGARFYNEGWGGNDGITSRWNFEFLSPRDWAGHGSHTSSTAGGNEGVPITGLYSGFGNINGIAPRARIAMYKVCWASAETVPAGGCFGSDTISAVEDAINDGVDVISFSVGGSLDDVLDPVEVAFLNAAASGVFVSAAAGNEGPDASTVNHPGPWVTTVAAGTHNRAVAGGFLNLNGTVYSGVTNVPGQVSANMINSTAAGLGGANATQVRQCFGSADGVSVLDPAKVTGKILVCERGSNFLINKSIAAQEAGAVGIVIVNVPGGATTTLSFGGGIPALHTVVANRDAIEAWAAVDGHSGTIGGTLTFNQPAPFTADFSSRGPTLAVNGNLLKPDIMAPGVDIVAAVAPPNNGGRMFDVYQGTSMATPHISGIAALFKQAHPDWSPMAIKSALMTSAGDALDAPNTDPAQIFAQGAGFVKPNAALDPGLVFDSNVYDWISFLCGAGSIDPRNCTDYYGIPVTDPVNFNSPSIAISSLAGKQVITRTVTNVSSKRSTYAGAMSGLPGFTVAMAPAKFTLSPGDSKVITLTFTRTKAELGAYNGGQFTLGDGTHKVRVPVVIQPVALSAPPEVSGSYNVRFGYTGKFNATVSGMVPATTNTGGVSQGDNSVFFVQVPAGTALARFQINGSDYFPGTDLDLYIYYMGDEPTLVGQSAGSTADERVDLANPTPGTYAILVNGFNVPDGSQALRTYNWSLGTAKAGNLTVAAPSAAATAAPGKITLTVNKALANGWWLGAVSYGGTTNMPAPTTVRIDKGVSPLVQGGGRD